MMNCVFINETGGPEVLTYGQKPIPEIDSKQILIKVHRSSINYIDTYHRSGLYKLPLPAILGRDGAGIVEKIGADVTLVKPGDRVAFFSGNTYAEYVKATEATVVKLCDSVTYDDGACMMIQGLTAHYLIYSIAPHLPSGSWVLIHAGAGGTGGLAIQLAKAKGFNVITTVGSIPKIDIAKSYGADYVINYSIENVVERVKEITNNIGVDLVLDGVGASTYKSSIGSIKRRGHIAFFGNASGPVPPLNPLVDFPTSCYICRPTMMDFTTSRDEIEQRVNDISELISQNKFKFNIAKRYTLDNVNEAHKDIESRIYTGKLLIDVIKE